MNRIQVANHEKAESIRTELRNFVRKFDAIETVISNIDTSIRQLKLNVGESSSSGNVSFLGNIIEHLTVFINGRST